MIIQKLKRLAWTLPALTSLAVLAYFFLLLPQLTKAQTSFEFIVSPLEQSVLPGTAAILNITITNTGAISLTNITVQPEAIRPAEAYFLKSCYQTLGTTNPLTNEFEPLILDIGESSSFTCGESGLYLDVQQNLLFSAAAIDDNSTFSDAAEVIVHVEHLLATFGTEYQPVIDGKPASLTLTIANTGLYNLTNISVTPRTAAFADCARTAGQVLDLAGGETTTVNCVSENIFDDVEAVFDLSATLNGNSAVSEAAYIVIDSVKGLSLEITPDAQTIATNTAANLSITLQNLDDALPLTNLTLTSADFPACSRSLGSLPDLMGGGSYQFECQTTPLTTNDTYTMTASAIASGLAVTATDQTTINADSQIDIQVSPSYVIAAENAPVSFTITATNNLISDTLATVTVSTTASAVSGTPSSITDDCARSLADIPPGGSESYTCQSTAVPGQPLRSFILTGYTPAIDEGNLHTAQANAYAGLAYTYLPVAMNDYHPPYSYPDLYITSLNVSQVSNDIYNVNIVVENLSTEAVASGNNFFVNAYLTSNLNSPVLVCSMQSGWFGAGQSRTCSGQITLAAGTHTIRAWADPYNTVTEEYENNNTRDLEVTHD
ncbi:MAG: hypothetical protein H6657_03710 [Ardenticatenaceae bacterium]|nr:hypothetical protein [Ardenticatenaceae bacterium]